MNETGFRLAHFELYNWGTYNNSIVKLELNGSNALLTGDIGSGKSTVVDALTTLLVPHQKIVYNKAAGAESKERSINSYILGEYKSSKDENLSQAKAVTLRDSSNTFSVLLGHFKNSELDETVTIAQFFYIQNSKVQKFFIVSKALLTIKDDFFDFKDIRELKKLLRVSSKTTIYESFSDYSKSFRRLMGIKNEQALNLFYQTVSLKAIGNLTQFIRSHMLEPSTMDSKIEELIQNFSELNHIHTLVLRAKREIELLTPIDKEGKKYEKNFEIKEEFESYREKLSPYFATFKIELLDKKVSELDIELSKRLSQKTRADTYQTELNATMIELQIELKQNGGDRIGVIDNAMRQFQKEQTVKKEDNFHYNSLAKELALPTASTEHRFLNNLKDAEEQFLDIEAKTDSLLNQKMMDSVTQNGYKENREILETEINYLKNNRSNIPPKISKIRDDMAKALSLNIEDLPFVGELIEVQDEKWEGAIERVLHSFALSLLVDNRYYEDVSEYVNSTKLSGKLVYLKVDTTKSKENFTEIAPSSLLNKINVKASSEFFDPLKVMLDDRFNIPCVENMSDFRRFKKALTINGLFKTNFSRHEKDDRFDINNSRMWVLGWENSSKLEKLENDLISETEKFVFISDKIKMIDRDIIDIKNSRDNLRDILNYKSFDEIDWYLLAKKIEELEEERKNLQESSNVLEVLENKIVEIREKLEAQKDILDKVSQKIGALKTNLLQRQNELEELHSLVKNNLLTESLKESIALYSKTVVEEKLNLLNIKAHEGKVKESIQKKITSSEKIAMRSSQKIIEYMSDFISEFPTESQEFDRSIDSLYEFRKKLIELKKDNLPKWEKRFKALFREKTIQNIVIVQTELEHQASEIESKIEKINSSLHDIEYNDGTYIELMAQKSTNIEIREFIQSLKQSISGSIDDDNSYDEEKFLQIKQIIERLKGREGYSEVDKKWRKLVTDVRNWFDFSAMERYVSDGSEKEYYPHSGGKSGGQKEKLAYTVLASSLAFQFGLEYNNSANRSFRFVMIDEAFGRGSDESSRYALRLFEKLQLQLLVITPKQKINIIEPFVNSVHFVHNQDGMNSTLLSMSIEDFVKNKNG